MQFRQFPTVTPASVICIGTGSGNCLAEVTKATDGSYKASVTYWDSDAQANNKEDIVVSGSSVGKWEHLVVIISSKNAVLQVTQWTQTRVSHTVTLLLKKTFSSWNPSNFELILGQVTSGEVSAI